MDENNQVWSTAVFIKIKVGAGLWPFLQMRYTKVIHQELPNVKKIKQELKQSHNSICNMYSFSIERIHISFNFFLPVVFTLMVSVLVCSFICLFIQQILSKCLGTTSDAENTSINGTCLTGNINNKQTYNGDIMAKKLKKIKQSTSDSGGGGKIGYFEQISKGLKIQCFIRFALHLTSWRTDYMICCIPLF